MNARVARETEKYESAAKDALSVFQSRQNDLDVEGATSTYVAAAGDAARRYEEKVKREAATAAAELEKRAREEARESVRVWQASQEVESQGSESSDGARSYHYTENSTHQSVSPYVPIEQGSVPAPFHEKYPTKKDTKEGSGFPMIVLWGFFIFGIFALNLCDSF